MRFVELTDCVAEAKAGLFMTTSTKRRSRSMTRWGEHDHTALVLQGGGALGAYQAGAYAALSDAGIEPDWVTGVSIGAINAALITGNPAKLRVQRLGEFWHRIRSLLRSRFRSASSRCGR